MNLREALSQRRKSIHTRWLDETLASYPTDAAGFFRGGGRDRFDNPVGHTFSENTRAVSDALIDGIEPKVVSEYLEKLIKIRSIQEMSASEAVGFIFQLKNVIRSELATELKKPHAQTELAELEHAIDTLALLAFDVYVRCREQLFDIRVDEVKRTVSGLLRRLNRMDEDLPPPVENVTRNR